MTTEELVEGRIYGSTSGNLYKITEKRVNSWGFIVHYNQLDSTGKLIRTGGRSYRAEEIWRIIPLDCVIEEDDLDVHALS